MWKKGVFILKIPIWPSKSHEGQLQGQNEGHHWIPLWNLFHEWPSLLWKIFYLRKYQTVPELFRHPVYRRNEERAEVSRRFSSIFKFSNSEEKSVARATILTVPTFFTRTYPVIVYAWLACPIWAHCCHLAREKAQWCRLLPDASASRPWLF